MSTAICTECGDTLRTDLRSGNWQWATGLVRLRPKGANQLSLATHHARWMCSTCHDLLAAGIHPAQGSLIAGPGTAPATHTEGGTK